MSVKLAWAWLITSIVILAVLDVRLAVEAAEKSGYAEQFQNWLKPKPKMSIPPVVPLVCPAPILFPLSTIAPDPHVTHTEDAKHVPEIVEPVPTPVPRPKVATVPKVSTPKPVVPKASKPKYRNPSPDECERMRLALSFITREKLIREAANRGFGREATENALTYCKL
jgi:hypothetical protein